jgi:hypothetical protein
MMKKIGNDEDRNGRGNMLKQPNQVIAKPYCRLEPTIIIYIYDGNIKRQPGRKQPYGYFVIMMQPYSYLAMVIIMMMNRDSRVLGKTESNRDSQKQERQPGSPG